MNAPKTNADIASVFSRTAELLEDRGANVFRVRGYRHAARVIDKLPDCVASMVAAGGDLSVIRGIGNNMAHHISRFVKTGRFGPLEDEERKAVRLRDATCIRRTMLARAEEIAEPLLAYMKEDDAVARIVIGGSYRRRKDTIGTLDIVATASKPDRAFDRFRAYPGIRKIMGSDTSSVAATLAAGIEVEFRIVEESSFGAALLFSTGTAAHASEIRKRAQDRGIRIAEDGIFRGGARLSSYTEEDVYNCLSLPFIAPELRENRGEIEAAEQAGLPRLVSRDDIRGDLHMHTKESDGLMCAEEMADAAIKLGYEYIAITDHTESLTVAHGLNEAARRRQLEAIDALNANFKGFRILKSAEVDILEDGRLDMSDSLLREMDLTVCSIHTRFDLPRDKQTERILRAMDNPYFTILGHPTGRLINDREPYAVDIEKIVRAAKERGAFLEINSQPDRLDLHDIHARMASAEGVLLSISTDAHSSFGLPAIRHGVDQARRGWLEAKDVLNARPLAALLKLLGRLRG